MESDSGAGDAQLTAERRRQHSASISCPVCSGAVPVLARCVDGDVEPVLACSGCGWTRRARREDRPPA